MKNAITIIGRGHSGTRAISHTLYASGVFMGNCLNRSGDKMPPQKLYDACRVMAKYVEWKGGLEWDFAPLHAMDIDPEFTQFVNEYLEDVLKDGSKHKGWKLPETTLIYPWILRMFPDTKYIHWVRDPRDSILSGHKTDDLGDFGIDYPKTDDIRERRAISWKYQYDLMQSTPQPAMCCTCVLRISCCARRKPWNGWKPSSASNWVESSCAPTRSAAGKKTANSTISISLKRLC